MARVSISTPGIDLKVDRIVTAGSSAYRSLDNALKHFDKLSNKFVRQFYVWPENPSDTAVIGICQPVGDNAI